MRFRWHVTALFIAVVLSASAVPGTLPARTTTADTGSANTSVATIPMPPEVVRWGAPRFVPGTRDGIVLDFMGTDGINHIGYVRADGSRFRCLSCTADAAQTGLGRPIPFGDGRRVLAQSPAASNGVAPLSFMVIECPNRMDSCTQPTVQTVSGVSPPDSLQDRVGLVSPDGSTLVWTRIRTDGFLMLAGRLDRTSDGYQVSDVRVLNAPADRATTNLAGLTRANAWYEAKSFSPDGQEITFGSTLGGSLNLDSYLMDLRTGSIRRLTRDPDWDEGLELSPDGRWFTQASSRGQHVTASFGNLPRPAVLDVAAINVLNYFTPRAVGPTEPYRRGAQRRPYVFGIGGESAQRTGMLLSTPEDDGWYVNDWPDWSGNGSLIVWAQARPNEPTVRQVRVARSPVAPGPAARPGRTPVPAWAPPIGEVPVTSLDLQRTFLEPSGGTASVATSGTVLSGTFSVTYTNFSVGCAVLNGVQNVVQGGALETRYVDHLTVTGCHNGSSDIDVTVYGTKGAGVGTATSTYDGRLETTTLTGPPA
jgi:hypothetical protein